MTTAASTTTDTAATVLGQVRDAHHHELVAQAAKLRLAVTWAAMHAVDSIDDAACFGNTPVPIAGPGAPLVAEFCVAEFAAALGVPTESGRDLLGEAVELAHRLPRVYAQVLALQLPAWRARRIARATGHLTLEAAGFVDRQVAAVAHKVGPTQLDRLIEEAIARFMPAQAQADAQAAWDTRHVIINHQQVSITGTSVLSGELDVADALDLEAAVARHAEARKQLGSTASLDVRHEMELFELIRALVDDGLAGLVITHQLNLAARFADRIVLLAEGRVAGDGAPDAVFRPELLARVFEWPLAVTRLPDGAPHAVPQRAAEWTRDSGSR